MCQVTIPLARAQDLTQRCKMFWDSCAGADEDFLAICRPLNYLYRQIIYLLLDYNMFKLRKYVSELYNPAVPLGRWGTQLIGDFTGLSL